MNQNTVRAKLFLIRCSEFLNSLQRIQNNLALTVLTVSVEPYSKELQ